MTGTSGLVNGFYAADVARGRSMRSRRLRSPVFRRMRCTWVAAVAGGNVQSLPSARSARMHVSACRINGSRRKRSPRRRQQALRDALSPHSAAERPTLAALTPHRGSTGSLCATGWSMQRATPDETSGHAADSVRCGNRISCLSLRESRRFREFRPSLVRLQLLVRVSSDWAMLCCTWWRSARKAGLACAVPVNQSPKATSRVAMKSSMRVRSPGSGRCWV